MKYKFKDTVYDTHEEPIMLIFDDSVQRITIANLILLMDEDAKKFCIYPETYTEEEANKFMMVD